MHLPVVLNVNRFVTEMEPGTLYFEFTDGFRAAIHYTLMRVDAYKDYINSLIADNHDRHLNHVYYKAFDLLEAGNSNTPTCWVDLKFVLSNGKMTLYDNVTFNEAYNNREFYKIDKKKLKGVQVTSKDYSTYIVCGADGSECISSTYLPTKNISIRDRTKISVEQVQLSDTGVPTTLIGQYHLKQDIKIESLTDVNLNDTLNWVGGVFCESSSLNDKTIVIEKGKMFLNTSLHGYKGADPLTVRNTPGAVATYDPDPIREDRRWDFDIKLFKWENVKISPFESPVVTNYDPFVYHDTVNSTDFIIDYVKSLHFGSVIDENHLLFVNGIIIDRREYDVVGSEIVLKGVVNKVVSLISESYKENGFTEALSDIVESAMPKAGDFYLVRFTHAIPEKQLILNRSSNCYKNHPYPFHITFPQFRVGDMIVVDGIYERYLPVQPNVIRFHYSDYMARYVDDNLLTRSNVERIWFTEI